MLDDPGGHRLTRLEGLVQYESILVIAWPSGMYARWPGARPEQ